ncbi:galectin-9 isoform X2 [Drosophila ficusphila]|uniref:galectin-9 isoform X2 n=1 Tax=Drosophila ficusphila TaxID=30025 RepID=UPI0007E7F3DD|nr:galectin-9 isoform X2 [Drosophila ficusphila]XP_017046281.1 galectin-9 isoform X2 [Drosophila ficusphila]
MCLRMMCEKLLCCCTKAKKGGLNEASFYEYADAVPKYYNDEIGQLDEGISFTVTGNLAVNCERFSINLVYNNESRDVALHINPRLPQNYIVRNTKVQDLWGSEEVSSALPFLLSRGEKFSIQVLVTDACYMISVNGQHFAKYTHRIPYKDVRILEVKGDVSNVEMHRTLVLNYPQRLPESEAKNIELNINDQFDEIDSVVEEAVKIPHEWCLISAPITQSDSSPKSSHDSNDLGLTLPYYGALPPRSLVEGRYLKIEGRVRLLPHSFYINLQKGQDIWPHPVIAFHLNPRFSKASSGAIGKAVVCRNAWFDGAWAQEERSEFDTNFRPGRTFSLAIVCTKTAYEVYVNRQFMTDFKYKVSPALVDTVYIQGDVKLWNVTLEHNPMIKGRNVRAYHNPCLYDDN